LKIHISRTQGIVLSSPISNTAAAIFLYPYENLTFKHKIRTETIIYYTRYEGDILIILYQQNWNGHCLTNSQKQWISTTPNLESKLGLYK